MDSPPCPCAKGSFEESPVLHYAVVFLVIALIAAVLGYGGIVTEAAEIAKTAFFVFTGLSAFAFLAGLKRRSHAPRPTHQERTRT
jgi:uncharacterized membrane protein YtjA (UPF0391 family)